MKKIIILITFLLIGIVTFAQTDSTYNKWVIGGEFGNHMIADKSATTTDNFFGLGLTGRYNINPKIGVGVTTGVDFLDLETFNGDEVDLTYGRLNAEIYLNAFNMVDIKSNRFTFLFHGGPGVSYISTDNGYSEKLPNIRGGATLLLKVFPKIYLKADMSVTANYDSDMTLDGEHPTTNSGVNAILSHHSIGLSFTLGEKERSKSCLIQPITNVYQSDTTLHNHYNTYVNHSVGVDTIQYVFFDNDEYVIKDTELNAIFKTYINLKDNPNYTVTVKGWASNSEDSTLPVNSNDYNRTLSENRATTLKDKLLEMGVSEERITIEYFGKDKTLPNESVHDTARRVELIISTN